MEYRARYAEEEVWKKVVGVPDYGVSSHGRVRRDCQTDNNGRRASIPGKIIKPRKSSSRTDHQVVTLSSGGIRMDRLVHRLVAEAFIGPEPEGMPFVCHKDGDAKNNHASNLKWGNGTTNAADRTIHGKTLRGDQVGNSKLSAKAVREIRSACAQGESQRTIALKYGVTQSNVSMIANRKTWGHV